MTDHRAILELRTSAVITSIREKSYSGEFPDEELKSEWPADPAKAAGRVAAMLNSSYSEVGIWVIGIDERGQRIVGCDPEDLADWWPSVQKHFDEVSPTLSTHLTLTEGELQVVALCFDAGHRPFLVKTGESPAERWVPWREGTRLRSARRSELISLLAPLSVGPLHDEAVKLQVARAKAVLDYFSPVDVSRLRLLLGISQLVELNGLRMFREIAREVAPEMEHADLDELIGQKSAGVVFRRDEISETDRTSVDSIRNRNDNDVDLDQLPKERLLSPVAVPKEFLDALETVQHYAADPLLSKKVREELASFLEFVGGVPLLLAQVMGEVWEDLHTLDSAAALNSGNVGAVLSNEFLHQVDLVGRADDVIGAVLLSLGIHTRTLW